MTIFRQQYEKVQKGLFDKFAYSSVIDKIHLDLLLNVAVQKKYSLIIYSLKLILYVCYEFKKMGFFLIRFLCVYIY